MWITVITTQTCLILIARSPTTMDPIYQRSPSISAENGRHFCIGITYREAYRLPVIAHNFISSPCAFILVLQPWRQTVPLYGSPTVGCRSSSVREPDERDDISNAADFFPRSWASVQLSTSFLKFRDNGSRKWIICFSQ